MKSQADQSHHRTVQTTALQADVETARGKERELSSLEEDKGWNEAR